MSKIIEDIYQGKNQIIKLFNEHRIISIAGGSCSGKTLIVNLLKKEIGDKLVTLPIDSYYKNGNKKTNFDHPNSLDLDLVYNHLIELQQGKIIQKPIYDFKTHSRNGTELVYSNDLILLEGLFALFPQFREISSYNIFMDVDQEIALKRRIKRDVKERGRTTEDVIQQYNDDVLPMYNQFVLPQQNYADLIITNNKKIKKINRFFN